MMGIIDSTLLKGICSHADAGYLLLRLTTSKRGQVASEVPLRGFWADSAGFYMDESSALSRKSLLLPSGVKVSPMGDILSKKAKGVARA